MSVTALRRFTIPQPWRTFTVLLLQALGEQLIFYRMLLVMTDCNMILPLCPWCITNGTECLFRIQLTVNSFSIYQVFAMSRVTTKYQGLQVISKNCGSEYSFLMGDMNLLANTEKDVAFEKSKQIFIKNCGICKGAHYCLWGIKHHREVNSVLILNEEFMKEELVREFLIVLFHLPTVFMLPQHGSWGMRTTQERWPYAWQDGFYK